MSFYRLDAYVPETHLETVKNALFEAGAGRIGNYDRCCWQTKGTGQFRPGEHANPFLGKAGSVERVEEWKIELVVEPDRLDAGLKALKEAHPYETPAFQYWLAN